MMATSKLWKYIVSISLLPNQKHSRNGVIDEEVSSLLLHVFHTNGEHWTADHRSQLRNKIYNDFGHAMVAPLQEVNDRERELLIHDQYTGREGQDMTYEHQNDDDGGEWNDGVPQDYAAEHDGEWA